MIIPDSVVEAAARAEFDDHYCLMYEWSEANLKVRLAYLECARICITAALTELEKTHAVVPRSEGNG